MTRSTRFPLALTCATALGLLAGMPAHAEDRSGKAVVEASCIKCHADGKDGAPRIGNAADWAPRARAGTERLLQSSMEGFRKMPAHGDQAVATDLEMTRAIAYMISGGKTPDPKKTFGDVKHGNGEQVVRNACINCHRDGTDGAPKMGDQAAWIPRAQKGFDELVLSAVHGHNKMKARGGFANLSDVDVRNAVTYMLSKASALPKK